MLPLLLIAPMNLAPKDLSESSPHISRPQVKGLRNAAGKVRRVSFTAFHPAVKLLYNSS
jgi:hypothetical protein